jgi:diaminohydroxyphosphoribosylaminopyrimidine deaminase/5-amino-6-(5-phosphoribosylamino)uracil reductase
VSEDTDFMRLALRLGRRGLGRTSPNPAVGAVVVAGGEIVGRGYHRRAGEPHAEIEALRDAGERARGSTLYVTLEPCNHHGRTPPCTESVLAAGIRRVVFGVPDPNRDVKKGGAERLRRRGVEVVGGVEAESCGELIAGFARYAQIGRPLVTLKLAASLDGRIATRSGASRWITGSPARRFVHRLRNETDAVMVGAGTVIADDPALTCRVRGGRDPLRVIVDGRLRVPPHARVLTKDLARGTLLATVTCRTKFVDRMRQDGVTVLVLPGRRGVLSLRQLLKMLGQRGVRSVVIEGGATLAGSALRERVVDRLLLFLAPKVIGGDGWPMISSLGVNRLADAPGVGPLSVSRLGGDLLIRAAIGGPRAV